MSEISTSFTVSVHHKPVFFVISSASKAARCYGYAGFATSTYQKIPGFFLHIIIGRYISIKIRIEPEI
jgi:hypothetical protein